MKKSIRTIILIIIFLGILIISNNVFAATADLSVDDSDKVITVGDTVTVTIKVNSAQWDLSVSANGLSYVSGTQRFTELDNAEGNLSKSATVKYKADKAGEFNISLSGDVTDISGENSDVSKTIKLTVKEKNTTNNGGTTSNNTNTNTNNGTTNNNTSTNTNTNTNTNNGTTTEQPKEKSTNAYLSTLGVRLTANDASELGVETDEYDFSGFKKTTTSYNVTVPYEVDSLKVSYKTADSNASVKVTGNSGFEVGSNNKIKVKVTAEDGKTTKTYTIKVTKLAEVEEKPGNVIEDDEGLYLTSLSIDGIVISPEFAKDTYAYTATLNDSDLTEVNVNATVNKQEANIEISGNTNLVVGENTITIVAKQENSSVQTVYQITLTKEDSSAITTTDTEDSNLMGDIMGSINKYVILAVGLVLLMIIAVITLIILLRKENKRLKNEETDNEYNVYKNDETEFEKNKIEEEIIEEKTNETETKNERRRTRREKGKHSK